MPFAALGVRWGKAPGCITPQPPGLSWELCSPRRGGGLPARGEEAPGVEERAADGSGVSIRKITALPAGVFNTRALWTPAV